MPSNSLQTGVPLIKAGYGFHGVELLASISKISFFVLMWVVPKVLDTDVSRQVAS